MSKQQLSGPMLTRELAFMPEVSDAAARKLRVSFSSEAPVMRDSWFDDPWIETLGHTESEVDLTRLYAGAPVLHDHDRTAHVGVVERAWLENGRGYADIKLSSRAAVDGLWQDIQDGIIRNTSVGYRVYERVLTRAGTDAPSEYRVTRWEPVEISLVSVPADASVGVGRGADTHPNTRFVITPKQEEDVVMDVVEPKSDTRAAPPVDVEAIRTQTAQEAIKLERQRMSDILTLARKHSAEALGEKAVASGSSMDEFRSMLLDHLAKAPTVVQPHDEIARPVSIQPGTDQRDKLRGAAVDWLVYRHGQQQGMDINGNPYRGMSLLRLAQDCLERSGERVSGLDGMEIAQRAITHSTSDFATVLENTMHKELQSAFTAVPDVWRTFSAVGSVSDFRPHYRYRMGTFGDILEVKENAEYQDATISDAEREVIAAKTKGRILNISRQMIINDDLGAFLGIARMMGRGAARTLEKDWFALLLADTSNGPLMGDSVRLFNNAGHFNAPTTGGITPATLDAARVALANQMDKDRNDYIGLSPFGILVPSGNYSTMIQLLRSEGDPTAANANSRKYNYVKDMVQTVVSTPRISNHWYLFTNPADEPVMEVAFLNGQQSPVLEMQEGWRVDGVSWKVRFDYGVAAIGWRGAVRTAVTA